MGSSNPLLDLLNLQNYQGVMGAPGQGPTFQPQGQTPQTPPLTGIDPTATASNPQGTQLPQNPLPTPGQPGFPDAGPPQAPPGIGHRILQSLQQNPQMLQALGQILMAKAGGKYGGYMAQGAQQQQQRGYENQLQQQQLNQQGQLQQAQIGNLAREEQQRQSQRWKSVFDDAVKTDSNIEDVAAGAQYELPKNLNLTAVNAQIHKLHEQSGIYMNTNPDSPNWASPTVKTDPDATWMESQTARLFQADAQNRIKPPLRYYIKSDNTQMLSEPQINSQYGTNIKEINDSGWDGPMAATEAVSRYTLANKPKTFSDAEAKSVLADPKSTPEQKAQAQKVLDLDIQQEDIKSGYSDYAKKNPGANRADYKANLAQQSMQTRTQGYAMIQDVATARKMMQESAQTVLDTRRNYDMMVQAANEATKQEQAGGNAGASDMLMISRHLGMTTGQVKGARTGDAMIEAHMDGRSMPENLRVLAYKVFNGSKLSPEQRQEFLKLGYDNLQTAAEQYQRTRDLTQYDFPGGEKMLQNVVPPNQAVGQQRTPYSAGPVPSPVMGQQRPPVTGARGSGGIGVGGQTNNSVQPIYAGDGKTITHVSYDGGKTWQPYKIQ